MESFGWVLTAIILAYVAVLSRSHAPAWERLGSV